MRVSYNGYYVSFPRIRRGFDYLHPHHVLFAAVLAVFCCLMMAVVPVGAVESVRDLGVDSPKLILYNLNDNKVLYEQEADVQTPVASLTKIMTAIITLENVSSLDEKVTITDNMLTGLEEFAIVGLKPRDVLTVRELLYATMLPSAGDAAQALAVYVGDSTDNFIDKMNTKVQELNLVNTHFNNAAGQDENNYSTARDIAVILKYALKNNNFKEIFEKDEYEIVSLGKKVEKTVKSKARQYGFDAGVLQGAKTGYTDSAGLCLASTATINGVNYLLVNLNATVGTANNITDALKIYDFYGQNYGYREIVPAGKTVWILGVRDSATKEIELKPDEAVTAYVPNDLDTEALTFSYEGVDEITREVKLGDYLGVIKVWNGEEQVQEFPVYLREDVKFYPYWLWNIMAVVVILGVVLAVVKVVRH